MECFEQLLRDLLSRVNNNSVPHAIIIESPKCDELVSVVNKFLKGMVCTSDGEKPCGKCTACKKVDNSQHPDIMMPTGSGVTKSFSVDTIRGIRSEAYIVPNEAKCKIYLFWDADKFTIQAQNAFLKLMEEPPKNVFFVILVESSLSLLPTILSRATLFQVNLIANQTDNSKAHEIADKIVKAANKPIEADLMLLGAEVTYDKQLFSDVIDEMVSIYGCVLKEIACDVKNVPCVLNVEKVIAVLEILNESKRCLNRNVNHALLVVWMLSQIREKIFGR